jgi:hypothetical protein
MPKGPKGQKRPADVIGNAVLIMKIATGEAEDEVTEKSPAAVARGRRGGATGGTARAAALSPRTRRTIAKKAAAARWSGRKKKV